MVGGGHLKRLMQAVEDLRSATTHVAQIDAARRIREAAELLEQTQIDAARAAGATWKEIGTPYGLSKQGAQQRFRGGPAK